MMKRLETISKGLAVKLVTASPEQRRKVSIVACDLALQTACIDLPIILETLEQLLRNGKLSQERITELNKLAAEFDEKYFDFQDGNSAISQAEALQ